MADSPKRLSNFFQDAGMIDRLGESFPALVYIYDLVERRNLFTNRPLAELLGYSPQQVCEMGEQVLSLLIHPDDLPRAHQHFSAMTRLAEGQVVEIEYRVRAASGAWLWLHSWESVLTRSDSGETRQLLGIAHDVTARVRAEEDLRDSQRRLLESEQRWRSIAENPFDFVVVIDRDYKYTFVNFAAPGLKRESLIGKATPFDFVSKDDRPVMQAAFDAAFNEGRASAFEVHIPTLDKWYSSVVGPIRDGDVVTHVSVLTRDTTTDKRVQQQARNAEQQVRAMELKLAHSAKLEAVGQLAGGIAHDFNNLLTGIAAIGDLLAGHLGSMEAAAADLNDLRQAVVRGAGMTRQLLAFSRQKPIASTVIDMKVLLDDSARMLRRLIGEDIEIDVSQARDGLFIRGDRTQIEQIVLNLALNARDAMPRGGHLQLTLDVVDFDEDAPPRHPDAAPGSYVQLRVRDSGIGMDPALLPRIFEPFFTTKPIGAGTGLGLALVHNIVQQTGGFIEVHSTPDVGTTFEINLPRCGPDAGSPKPLPPLRRGGDETIFLVEDDAMALRLVKKLLTLLGYQVETEERGDVALRRIEAGLPFDLLLTDVLLPGMDGHTLYQRARLSRPALAAVFMSGYTADIFADKGIADLGTAFLAKPFSHDELADKVRVALDARAR